MSPDQTDTPTIPVPISAGQTLAPLQPLLGASPDPTPGASPSPEPKPVGTVNEAAPVRTAGAVSRPVGPEPAVLLLDKSSKIVAAHPSCAALFGQNHTELVGLHLEALLLGSAHKELQSILQGEGASNQGEYKATLSVVIKRKDGTEQPTRITLKRLWRNSQFCWTATLQEEAGNPDRPRQAATLAVANTETGSEPSAAPTQNVQVTLQGAEERAKLQEPSSANASSAQQEVIAKYQKDRAMLIQRIYTAETDLYSARAELERVHRHRESQQKKFEELTAGKAELEKQLEELRQTQGTAELERLKTELQKLTDERQGLETEWREKLDAAKVAADQSAATFKEKEDRCAELEKELAAVRQERQQLEQQQRQGAADLERAKADLQQLADQKQQAETEWRGQLDAAKAAGDQGAAALKEKEDRCAQLEEELERAKSDRQQLSGERQRAEDELREQLDASRSVAERTAAAVKEKEDRCIHMEGELAWAREVRAELEEQQRQAAAELERVKTEFQQLSAQKQQAETESREQLDAAKTAAEQSATSLKDTESRRAQLADELASVRQQRDDFEQQHRQATADLERAKDELQQQSEARQRTESDLREQLDAAKTAGEQSAASLKDTESRRAQLADDLAAVRQQRDELERQHRQSAVDLKRTKADLQQLSGDRQRVESDLREQLTAAKSAGEKSESSLRETETRRAQLADDLAAVRQQRNEFEQQQQQAASELERAKADLQQSSEERQRIETELREQLAAAKTATEQNAAALKEAETRRAQSADDLVAARQQRDEFEQQQNQTATELERAKTDLQQLSEERKRSEVNLRKEIDDANAAAELSAAALKEKESRCAQLEEELAGLRPVSSELQQQLHQSVLDLERAKADFQQQLQERQRAETELCEQLDAAKAAGELSAIDLKEKVGRCGLLEEALTGVRQVRDDLLQQQRRNEADLERVRTELQQLSQERQQVEAELCEQLDAAKAAADQNANALKEKAGRCARLEEELAGLRQVREELDRERQRGAADLERAEADLQLQSLERQQVERELRQQLDTASAEAEQSVIALKESESRCARLEEDLRKLRQTRDEFQLQHGQSATELQRAKAELQRETEARLRLEFQNRALAEEKEALNQELSLLRESQSARTVKPITKQSPAGESTEAAAQGNSAPEPTGNQSFRLTAPKAAEVLLAGDFTDWKKRAIPMHKDNDGRWTASVKLAPGTYNYLFIVDNQWRSDPESTLQVANQFGGLNSVRKVV